MALGPGHSERGAGQETCCPVGSQPHTSANWFPSKDWELPELFLRVVAGGSIVSFLTVDPLIPERFACMGVHIMDNTIRMGSRWK